MYALVTQLIDGWVSESLVNFFEDILSSIMRILTYCVKQRKGIKNRIFRVIQLQFS